MKQRCRMFSCTNHIQSIDTSLGCLAHRTEKCSCATIGTCSLVSQVKQVHGKFHSPKKCVVTHAEKQSLAMSVLSWLWYPFTAVTAGRSCAVTFLPVREVVTILLGVSGSLRSVTTRGPHTSASFRRDGRNVTQSPGHLRAARTKSSRFSPTQLTVWGTFNGYGGKQPKSSYKCFAHRPISSSAPLQAMGNKAHKTTMFLKLYVVLSSPSRTRRRLEQLSLHAACPHRVKSASSGTFGRHACHHRATRVPCSHCQCSHSTFEQKCFANWAPCHAVVHCLDASPPPSTTTYWPMQRMYC